MARSLVAASIYILGSVLAAQDPMWVANRSSSDLSKVSLCGAVSAPVPIGANLRRVRQAPDGKLWVIKFIQATFDIRNADGTLFLTVTSTVGSPYDVAFDRFGHAWLTGGGTAVQEYDANGVPVLTYPLTAASALGITIDADGNKWIAHRIAAPGSVSRIDAITGVVTNHVGPTGSNIQPTGVVADFRGVGVSSHIWVVGDSGTTVLEYDNLGAGLGAYVVGASLSSLATDLSGVIWCGSFGTGGNIYRVDPNTGTVINSFAAPPAVLGLEFDSFGRLWATVRLTSPTPSEVRRLDPLTGALEVAGTVGLATQSALSTRHHFAMVVDPVGDADGDFDSNIAELVTGTSPYDPQSSSFASLTTTGSSAQGAAPVLSLNTQPANLSLLAAAAATLSPGVPIAGATGLFLLDPGAMLLDPSTGGFLVLVIPGPFSLTLQLPNPGPVGLVLSFQAATFSATETRLTNAPCLKF